MEHMDMIDKLREKAGITREEAADALTRADWDMLEALVILEREGRIAPLTSSVVTSDTSGAGAGAKGNGFSGAYGGCGYAGAQTGSARSYGYAGNARSGGPTLGDRIRTLAKNSIAYSFLVRREGKVVISLPVLVFLIILLAAFRITAVALLVGLFCGCRFSLEKRDGQGQSQGQDPGQGE